MAQLQDRELLGRESALESGRRAKLLAPLSRPIRIQRPRRVCV